MGCGQAERGGCCCTRTPLCVASSIHTQHPPTHTQHPHPHAHLVHRKLVPLHPHAIGGNDVAAAQEDDVAGDELCDIHGDEGAVALDRQLTHETVLEGCNGGLCVHLLDEAQRGVGHEQHEDDPEIHPVRSRDTCTAMLGRSDRRERCMMGAGRVLWRGVHP